MKPHRRAGSGHPASMTESGSSVGPWERLGGSAQRAAQDDGGYDAESHRKTFQCVASPTSRKTIRTARAAT